MNSRKTSVMIELMDCVTGTTTSSEGMALFVAMDKAFKSGKSVKLSLKNSTPLSSSFLNSSFGELYEKYGYVKLKRNIAIVNYLPSQALVIKKYLATLDKLVK